MKTKACFALALFVLFVFPCLSFASTADPIGDPCTTDNDCPQRSDLTIPNVYCCQDADFCGDYYEKCVLCKQHEDCWEDMGEPVAMDGDDTLYGMFCIEGVCLRSCPHPHEHSCDSEGVACVDGMCHICDTDEDCNRSDAVTGVCINHHCFDCRTDADCHLKPDTEDVICEVYQCQFVGVTDGDTTTTTDGDTNGEQNDDDDSESDDDSCRSAGASNLIYLAFLLPLLWRRKRVERKRL